MQYQKIDRTILQNIQKSFFQSDVIILVWPRQVGKTTLFKTLLQDIPENQVIQFNGDYIADRQSLQFHSQEEIDYLEVGEHLEKAYECKWQLQKYIPPKAFTGAYPGVSVELIHQENYFLSLVR